MKGEKRIAHAQPRTIEIWDRVRCTLSLRVNAILDNMFVELLFARFEKWQHVPMSEPPDLRADDRSKKIANAYGRKDSVSLSLPRLW